MKKRSYKKIKIIQFFLLLCSSNYVFSNNIEKGEFAVGIGNKKSNFDTNETITFSGTNGKLPSNSLNNKNLTREEKIENIMNSNNEMTEKDISSLEAKNLFESSLYTNKVLTFKGGKKGKEKYQQNNNEVESKKEINGINNTTSDIVFKKTSNYADLAKEIAIPTNFDILKNALKFSNSSYASMPTSMSPAGLPEFSYNAGIIDESDLRSVIRSINKANKNSQEYHLTLTENVKNNKEKEDSSKIIPFNPIEQKWYAPLKQESQLMMLSGLPMKILLITSKDDLMYHFMINNVLKGKEEELKNKKFDDGIFALLGKPIINERIVPMCYLVFDDLINEYNNKILMPLENEIGKEATASLIIGHNVAICLDQLERENKIFKANTWFSNEVYKIGLYQNTFQSLFPRGMKPSIFALKENEIMLNNAQKQYQQRLADSFAVLWSYNRGFKNSYQAYMNVKSYVPDYSTHNTLSALKNLNPKFIQMRTNTLTLSQIWKIARENQKNSGVSQALNNLDYNILYKPQISELKQQKEKSIVSNYYGKNQLGNPSNNVKNMQEMKSMKEVNNMANLDSSDKIEKNKKFKEIKDMKNFEQTKTNKLSSLNFDVAKMLHEDIEDSLIKNKTLEIVDKVENKLVKDKILSDENKKAKNFDEIKKGLYANNRKEKVVEKEKQQQQEEVKQPEVKDIKREEKMIKVEDKLRDSLLKEYKFDINSSGNNQNDFFK